MMKLRQAQKQAQVRSRQAFQVLQEAVRTAQDSDFESFEQVDLDDASIDSLLSGNSDDFLTNFVQASGE